MILHELPMNTLVELQFNYHGVNYRVKSALLYKLDATVYFSAVRGAGKTISASKLKDIMLIYKAEGGIYLFKDLPIRSISYNGIKLYGLTADKEGKKVRLKNTYRLFVGAPITAKIMLADDTYRYANCILKDISMTGMTLICREKIDDVARIQISFRVNEEKEEHLISNIVQSYEFKNGTGFFYNCEFEEPNETIGKFVASHYEKEKSEKVTTEKINTEKINTEKRNTERANTDRVNTEQAYSEKKSGGRPGGERSNIENTGIEKINIEKSSSKKIGSKKRTKVRG